MIPRNNNFWFSNFYQILILILQADKVTQVVATCVESAFHALKTTNPEERLLIASMSGLQARKYAQRNKLPSRVDSVEVMKSLLRQKFKHPEMRKLLLETEDKLLVYHNDWHDNQFGHCICNRCRNNYKKDIVGNYLRDMKHVIMAEGIKPLVKTQPEEEVNDLQPLQAEGTNSVAPEPTPEVKKPKRTRKSSKKEKS